MTDLNPIPNRATRPDTIDDDADSFFTKLPAWGAELQALYAGMSAAAAGGAYAIPYVFDSNTTTGDPGNGKFRFGSTTQSSSTSVCLDNLSSSGADVSGLLTSTLSSSNGTKGKLRLVKQGDATKWITFDVLSGTTPAGFVYLTITNAWGASPSPFVTGDAVLMFFDRAGDKGDTGPNGLNGSMALIAQATVGTPVVNIDFLNTFTSGYDKYVIELGNLTLASSATLQIALANGGVVDAASGHYPNMVAPGNSVSNTGLLVFSLPASTNQVTGTFELTNTNAALSLNKTIKFEGVLGGYVASCAGTYAGGAVSGFRLTASGAVNFTSGTVRIYGIRNT